jgi:fibronectin type 3 domain-containing protein
MPGKRKVTLSWSANNPKPGGGYRIYYDQSGKLQLRAGVAPETLEYTDNRLSSRTTYTYVITAWNDCDGNGLFETGVDQESAASEKVSATAQ